jgi:hypothetical protein
MCDLYSITTNQAPDALSATGRWISNYEHEEYAVTSLAAGSAGRMALHTSAGSSRALRAYVHAKNFAAVSITIPLAPAEQWAC